jgi:hypothetical protein
MDLKQQDSHLIPLAAGGVSALLYGFSLHAGFFSLLMGYLPLIPLLGIGLAFGSRQAAIAGLAASLLAILFTGLDGMMLFLILYAAPSIFFSHMALTVLPNMQAFPIGGALTGLSLYGAVIMFIFVNAVVDPLTGAIGGIESVEPNDDMPELWAKAEQLMTQFPFVIFGIMGWVQILMFYAFAQLTNFTLKSYDLQCRSHMRLTRFMPSLFILAAMLIAGLVSFSAAPNWQVAGKSAFIILLLPYFLMGIAQMHEKAKHWPNAPLWLFSIYTITILVFWPVLWFIASGLYEQAKFLSNRSVLPGTDD